MRRHSHPFAAAVVVLAIAITACGANEPVGPDPAEASGGTADAAAADETPTTPDPEDVAEDIAEDAADDGTDDGTDDVAGSIDNEADCSAQGTIIDAQPSDGMPAEVAAARDVLLDAALRCDEQMLFTAIEESESFSFSFGDHDDAIGYWWDLEAAGDEPFLRLAQVLGTTPSTVHDGQLWVWPQVHTGRAEDTTAEAWAELTWLDDPAAIRASHDGYLDWRVGISSDGEWRFFVRGD